MTYVPDEPDIVVVDIAAEETVSLMQQKQVDPMNSGFSWYTPPMAKSKEHQTGGHEWMISGHDMQVLTSTLPPGEEFITETGSFMFGSAGIKTTVELTCCTRGSCSEGIQRILGGESCVKVLLRNEGSEEGFVGITPNFPAKIVPIKVSTSLGTSVSICIGGTGNWPRSVQFVIYTVHICFSHETYRSHIVTLVWYSCQ
jgi:hypothetical protein